MSGNGAHAEADLVVTGGTAITFDATERIVSNAVITVRDGRIASISSGGAVPPAKRRVDASGCLVLPGFVNAHTHVGMTLLRGIADDLPLDRWLHEGVFPLERKYGTREFVAAGTRLALLEMLRTGTTTFSDMYYFQAETARVASAVGVRAVCGETIISISGVGESPDVILGKFDEFREEVTPLPLVTPAIAPHSVYGLPPELWRRVVEYAGRHQLLLHTHLSETEGENAECLAKYGDTPTKVLHDWGVFSVKAVGAHGVCFSDGDIALLASKGVAIVHNPDSNMKLGTKICRVAALRKAGIAVALGTDGAASNNNLDIVQEAGIAAKLQSFAAGPGAVTAKAIARMMTIDGARAVGLQDRIGSIEVGKEADLVALTLDRVHAVPLYDPYSHLVYSASGQDAHHVVIAGRVMMENGRVLAMDEKAVLEEAREWGRRIAPDRAARPSA